jgi:acetone carboxylase gamma subunit
MSKQNRYFSEIETNDIKDYQKHSLIQYRCPKCGNILLLKKVFINDLRPKNEVKCKCGHSAIITVSVWQTRKISISGKLGTNKNGKEMPKV